MEQQTGLVTVGGRRPGMREYSTDDQEPSMDIFPEDIGDEEEVEADQAHSSGNN
jgi:hypothetical protein